MTVGERIYKLRLSLGLSQKEFADILGVAQSSINYWENGKREPKINQLIKISEKCNVPVTELLDITIKNLSQDKIIPDYYIDLRNELVSLFDRMDNNDYKDKAYGLMCMYDRLNNTGKNKAIEQVELLAKIPEYKKEN